MAFDLTQRAFEQLRGLKRVRPKCFRCDVNMKLGKALQNGFTGSPDFLGDQSGVKTISADPKKVKMVDCWKCPKCGHSIGLTK